MLDLLLYYMCLILLMNFYFNWWVGLCMMFFSCIFVLTKFFSVLFISNISFYFGSDNLSLLMILLSIWIVCLSIIASSKFYKSSNYEFFFVNLCILLLILIFTFLSLNFMLFFFSFESSLIPTLFLIIGWGFNIERINSGYYLFFYTIFGSVPLFMSLSYFYLEEKTMCLSFLNLSQCWYMYISFSFAFMVKMPMYLTHSWLPKAHVEAPVSGSMILAGILLKLGGYGLIRFLPSLAYMNMTYSSLYVSISLIGAVFSGLSCMRQVDMKSLIAYSSISHMGLVIGGIVSFNDWGKVFSIIMMVAHGLCSSGLFYLANMVYERSFSRNIYLNKGSVNMIPNMSMWWFLFCACNMSSPPSLNLLGEIGLMNSLFSFCDEMTIFPLMGICYTSGLYSLYLYSFGQHGKLNLLPGSFFSSYIFEFLTICLHWLILNLMFLKVELFF